MIAQADSDFLRQRQAMQRPYLDLLAHEYGQQMTITHLPLFPNEMKGPDRLRELEALLFNSRKPGS